MHDWTATAIGTVGVALLLLAFLLNLARKLRADTHSYLLMNLMGAALAGFSSYLIRFWPFVVLEGVWALVAAVGLARLARRSDAGRGREAEEHEEEGEQVDDLVVDLPITDALDLHAFRPNETADVVRDYLEAAIEKGLREVRIIHGRGIGTQREIVRRVLSRDARVASFADAPADRGGWGATVVELRSDPESGERR